MGKVQVCKMAKELDVPSKDLVQLFNDMGFAVKNHLAWVDDAEADAVKKRLAEPKPAPEPTPEPKAAPVAARPVPGPVRQPQPQHVAVPQRRPELTSIPRPVPRPELRQEPGRPAPRPMGPRPAGPGGPGAPGERPSGPPRGGERPAARHGERRGDDRNREREPEMQLPKANKPRRKSKAEIRAERAERRAGRNEVLAPPTGIELVGALTVKELSEKMRVKETEVIKRLFMKGILATINQTIEKETAEMIAVEMGYEVTLIDPLAQMLQATEHEEEQPENLQPRPPIVTVMGHVDHGKTSLLDALRSARVAAGEAGGITQHIGAYMTSIHGNEICFLDTPGHEAFTAMRARGAKATDIAILVVAADDGVMPQTVEAINHAKAAGVPIIVAINKIDKPGANPDRVKQELTEHELVPEEWGGQTVTVEVSAKQKLNLEQLLEMILLVAEVQELKANPDREARGMIVEAKLSKGMGPVATVLVQNGTLRVGDSFVVGAISGRVRALINDRGKRVKEAGPAHPVEVLGLPEVPHAGDIFQVCETEKQAREIATQRAQAEREAKLASRRGSTLANFYMRMQEGQKELPVILKADVKGSSEAIEQSLSQLNERTEGATVRILHSGTGDISETDITLAQASDALVIGFNVKIDDRAARAAEEGSVDVRMYSIIYKMIEDLEKAMQGLMEPEYETVLVGKAEVRATFKSGKTTVIAGSMVTEGKIVRNADIKLMRGTELVHEGKLASLKRFKDDAKEVATGYECGIALEKFNDLQEGDIIEAYITQEKGR
ncbi:MAG TPA: translation initiation factor IF-2 [Oscillatoriaceae cyanobacterium]